MITVKAFWMKQQRTLWILMLGVAVLFFALATVMLDLMNSTNNEATTDEPQVEQIVDADTGEGDPLPPPSEGFSEIDPPRPITEFTFTADDGLPLSLSNLRGRYVLLAFGYTHCPDVCPSNLLEFRQVKRALGEQAEDVAFVFISVDPDRDSPEFLNRYLQRYDTSFIGLQGDDEGLNAIKDDFGLFWDVRRVGNETNYIVDHTASRFLLNPDGELIRIYSFTTTPRVMEEDIRALLDA